MKRLKTRWGMVLLGSALGAGVVLGIMLLRTKKELEERAIRFRQDLESEQGQAIVTQQMAQMRTQLAAQAERVAVSTADNHVGTVYGLTQARMQGVEALLRQYGVT
jgi:hypothetical protein